jgi:serine protease
MMAGNLRHYCCLLTLVWVLSGCNQETLVYSLNVILPSPAMPGEMVTAYGQFPAKISATLGDEVIAPIPISGGFQFTVPANVVANTYVLEVKGGPKPLAGIVHVLPKIQQVSFTGQELTIAGLGWPLQNLTGVKININGTDVTPTIKDGKLVTAIPLADIYGTISIRVDVNGQPSNIYNLVREAGAIEGKFLLPASNTDQPNTTLSQQPSLESLGLSSFILFGDFDTSSLSGLNNTSTIKELNATRVSFVDPKKAKAAYDLVKKAVEVEWDAPVQTDGLEVQSVDPNQGAGQWYLPLLGVDEAWDITKGAGVTVAVVDTGVVLNHPDLQNNLLPGYDFVGNDSEPNDIAGHGTHVAGIIAANGQVMGVAPEANILPVRSLEGTSGGSSFTVAQGILWAAGLLESLPNPNPAQIINLSLGTTSYSETLASAIKKAQDSGVIIVAATGNSGEPLAYPAALPRVVSVTSLAGPVTTYQPWYANRGLGIWITAFGGDTTQDQNKDGVSDGILSTDVDGYGLRMGTSMASPQAAGILALALASGTPTTLARDTLAGTATDLGVMGYDLNFGYGLVSARLAATFKPRVYILVLDQSKKVKSWTIAQDDTRFRLDTIPSGTPLSLVLASDSDGDNVLGEVGEFWTSREVTVTAGEVITISDIILGISDGSKKFQLEARP